MKYPLTTRAGLLFSLALLPALSHVETLHAETIVIPVGQQTAGETVSTPVTGMSMATVESRFGAPEKRFPAKGQPPITRWEYGQFVVYFENDKVIHSVVRFKPAIAQP